MIRVLIADDHMLIRKGLRTIFSETPDILVVGEAEDAQQTLEITRIEPADVLVLDLRMPDRSGYDILEDLKNEHPHLPVLVLSMYADPELAIRVLRLGGDGYITKDSLGEELVEAVRVVAKGEKYISPSLAVKMVVFGFGQPASPVLHTQLSEREFEVLRLIGRGKSPSEIAEELSISVKTVGTYRSRLMEKMHLKTTAEIIRYALQYNLVD